MSLRHQFETNANSFDGIDDILSFVNESIKDSNHWLAVESRDFVKRYREAGMHVIVSDLSIAGSHEKYDVIFSAMPKRIGEFSCISLPHLNGCEAHNVLEGHKGAVLALVGYFVQSVEKSIPSWVWLQRAQEFHDFDRKVPKSTTEHILKVLPEGGVCPTERELRGPIFDSACEFCDSEQGLIQGGLKVVGGIESDRREFWRDGLEIDVMKILGSSTIWLDKSGVRFIFEESLDLPIQIGRVILCACNM